MMTATTQITSILEQDFSKCDSASLRLNKLVCFKEKDDDKKRQICSVVNCHNNNSQLHLEHVFAHPTAITLDFKLQGRLIVNQSGGILENANLCLDHFGNYPYIPGSAVKGCCRHYAWEQWYRETDETKKKELARDIAFVFGYPTGDAVPSDKKASLRASKMDYLDEYLAAVFPGDFGCWMDGKGKKQEGKYAHCQGNVAFLAAFPTKKAKLVVDMLNCHHMNYYTGGKTGKALDNEKPNLQYFPAVEANQTFRFQLVPLRKEANLELVSQWLRDALFCNGIGAKGAAGYGWFDIDKEQEEIRKKERELEEKRKAEEAEAALRQLKLQEQARQEEAKNQEIVQTPFNSLLELNWQKFRGKVEEIFHKSGDEFTSERRRELLEAILSHPKITAKNLDKGCWKTLDKWLGEELRKELIQRKK